MRDEAPVNNMHIEWKGPMGPFSMTAGSAEEVINQIRKLQWNKASSGKFRVDLIARIKEYALYINHESPELLFETDDQILNSLSILGLITISQVN